MENERNAYQLATLADCTTPDSHESPGAKMLVGIADEVYENIDDLRETPYPEDLLHDIVDGWPSVYTHEMWTQFVDIATQESPDDESGDMVRMAYSCLYQIGERLAAALWEEISENLPESCEDCKTDLDPESGNVVCPSCDAERRAEEEVYMEADIRDAEAQVEGDPS